MQKAEHLMREIVDNPRRARDGETVNDLLREFHRGYPVEKLRTLLSDPSADVVRAGVFIAAELGSRARPLLHDISRFLSHPLGWVKSDAIDAILTCTTEEDTTEIASVVSMIDDPDAAIRWKVMEFLTRLASEQIRAAIRHYEGPRPDSDHVRGLRWLMDGGRRDPEEITSWLRSSEPLRRKYGAVAAARIAATTRAPLEFASSLDDGDVKEFAQSMLKMGAG